MAKTGTAKAYDRRSRKWVRVTAKRQERDWRAAAVAMLMLQRQQIPGEGFYFSDAQKTSIWLGIADKVLGEIRSDDLAAAPKLHPYPLLRCLLAIRGAEAMAAEVAREMPVRYQADIARGFRDA